ncbi:integrase catalytic domain-containing protein [Trichonephila clavipes]|nr:integrase catalytic domain-containing protein [Trichonephila clavipes]
MLRFVENVKKKREFREIGDLTIHEIEHAEKTLIKIVQAKFFPSENSFPNMNVITDEEGECLFTQRLIEYYHRQNCHAGTQILLGILRERFWILRSRRVVRKIVRSCIRCKRYKYKSPNSEPVSLPGDRVNDAAVFKIVGVDLAGPLYVKGGQKSWIVLFTCATYRAIHLELTSSLSTDAFLLSLRRFIARRGRPRVIYSDSGTNFRGAHGELSGIDWEKVLKLATIQRIIWKFNPPTAAWWDGWWERLVRVLKELLGRTLGNAILTTEELQTVLCDCESVINSRPLTYLSENSDDLVPLSPAMFLVENRNLDVPDIDYRDTVNLRKRVRYRQKLLNDLKHRFRKEYLGLLIQNKNKKRPLSEVRLGEIVLIGDDIKKRMHWPLAKVIRLIPGKDGKIRTVELKTLTGTMLRPIQRVYPLEVQSTETPNDPLNDCTITNPISSISSDNLSDPNDSSNVLPRVSKYGRVIKVPEKLDLLNQGYVFTHAFRCDYGSSGRTLPSLQVSTRHSGTPCISELDTSERNVRDVQIKLGILKIGVEPSKIVLSPAWCSKQRANGRCKNLALNRDEFQWS